MAQIILPDTPDITTALAELLYGTLDQDLDASILSHHSDEDSWSTYCRMLAVLACNDNLAGCLSTDEVQGLLQRYEDFSKVHGWPSPNDYMFDN